MSKYVKRPIPARALITGIRAIGYSFATAVADIIDNSISAFAKKIQVISDPLAEDPFFCILDDGSGMDTDEIDNAMLLGSDRSKKEDSVTELGRFGLGLKSASLSQCRKLIVATKKKNYNVIIAMSLDLDIVERDDEFLLGVLNGSEIDALPCIDLLKNQKSGTLVIWNKFDRIETSAKSFEDSFRHMVAEAKKHVEWVFHDFYTSVEIYFDNFRIEKRDPFLLSSTKSLVGRGSNIKYGKEKINVIPYTLPFANTLTTKDRELLGNPKSIYDDQGFYLYRNKRLISWGGWMRMGYKSELNKLARVRVDFPSSLDSLWTLDVKKSSAKIPDKLKDEIIASLKDAVKKSNRVTTGPGIRERDRKNKLWLRHEDAEHNVTYRINRDDPVIRAMTGCLGKSELNVFEVVLSQLECCFPKYSILNDHAESLNIVNSPDDIELEAIVSQIQSILAISEPDERENEFEELMDIEAYHKYIDKKDLIRKKVFK